MRTISNRSSSPAGISRINLPIVAALSGVPFKRRTTSPGWKPKAAAVRPGTGVVATRPSPLPSPCFSAKLLERPEKLKPRAPRLGSGWLFLGASALGASAGAAAVAVWAAAAGLLISNHAGCRNKTTVSRWLGHACWEGSEELHAGTRGGVRLEAAGPGSSRWTRPIGRHLRIVLATISGGSSRAHRPGPADSPEAMMPSAWRRASQLARWASSAVAAYGFGQIQKWFLFVRARSLRRKFGSPPKHASCLFPGTATKACLGRHTGLPAHYSQPSALTPALRLWAVLPGQNRSGPRRNEFRRGPLLWRPLGLC